jgi:hypothetical protein
MLFVVTPFIPEFPPSQNVNIIRFQIEIENFTLTLSSWDSNSSGMEDALSY